MFCNIPLLALLIAGQPVATHRLFNLLRPRIKRQRSKQNRKIFILRLLFFVSPLRYTQSRGSARALFRLCNQRLLRSLHFRFAHNGGGIMLRALLVLPVASRHRHSTPAYAKKKRLIQVVGKSIGKKGKESLFLKQYYIFQAFIILRFSLYLLFIFFCLLCVECLE